MMSKGHVRICSNASSVDKDKGRRKAGSLCQDFLSGSAVERGAIIQFLMAVLRNGNSLWMQF